jgi:hypothetical protein
MSNSSKQEAASAKLKRCSICGQPTKSRYAVCNRADSPCRIEYQRLWALDQDKEHRNAVVRRYRRNQKQPPRVYGVLFPAAAVLKIGLTTSSSSALYTGIARRGARDRGWDVTGSSCIWSRPGDVRTEAWIQATLSFRWPPAFRKYQNRVCEWFDVSGVESDVVKTFLDEVYREVPVDLVPEAALSATAGAMAA